MYYKREILNNVKLSVQDKLLQLGGFGTWMRDLVCFIHLVFLFQGDKRYWYFWYMRMVW